MKVSVCILHGVSITNFIGGVNIQIDVPQKSNILIERQTISVLGLSFERPYLMKGVNVMWFFFAYEIRGFRCGFFKTVF